MKQKQDEYIENELKDTVEGIEASIEQALKDAYKRGYEQGCFDTNMNFKREYELNIERVADGLERVYKLNMKGVAEAVAEAVADHTAREVWDIARRIVCNEDEGGLSTIELRNIFGKKGYPDIFSEYQAYEVINRIREYDKQQKDKKKKITPDMIEVGDEVIICCEPYRAIITAIEQSSDTQYEYNVTISNGAITKSIKPDQIISLTGANIFKYIFKQEEDMGETL